MKHKPFSASLVKTKLINSNRDGYWRFQKSRVTGTIYEYEVEDKNFDPLYKWVFEVCVPNKFQSDAYTFVKPTRHPQKSYWAGTERQTINFARRFTPKLILPMLLARKTKLVLLKENDLFFLYIFAGFRFV
jgi:hypothetical protein